MCSSDLIQKVPEEEKKEGEFVFEGISPEVELEKKKRAESFKFFGAQPSPEIIEKIREPFRRELGAAGISLAAGLGGLPGNILQLVQKAGLDFLIPGFKQQRGFVGKTLGLEEELRVPTSEDIREFLGKKTGIKEKELSKPSQLINKGLELGDRKSTRLNSSHIPLSRMPSSA